METVSPQNKKIGWIGTGVMGLSMCSRLIDAGYTGIHVFSRTKSKSETLLFRGATWCDSPAEVAKNSNIVFSIVGYPQDVRAIHLGANGTLSEPDELDVIVDMTTSDPSLAIDIYKAASERGVQAIDAPVSGGDVGAKNGALSIMVGGDPTAVNAIRPFLEIMGKTIVHQGPAGSGQHTKMVNQILIATNMIGVCESLLYAYKAGLDLETVMQSVSSGAAGSWSLSNLGPRIIDRNFDPGFFVEHFIKDMGIALRESQRMGISVPGLSLAHQLYLALAAQGGSRMGTHALQLALSRLSNIDWQERTA